MGFEAAAAKYALKQTGSLEGAIEFILTNQIPDLSN